MSIAKSDVFNKYKAVGQEHVFRFYDELTASEQQLFLQELDRINLNDVEAILRSSREPVKKGLGKLMAAEVTGLPKDEKDSKKFADARQVGMQLIKEGKVACFVVAGGQGSRLGYEGPKGAFNVGLPSNKSLFELQADQISAASQYYGVDIPWYIMTSDANHKETVEFFEKNAYFSMKPALVKFFMQEMLPAVDKNGKLILAEKNHLFLSPNGHGGSLLALARSGALEEMENRGIQFLSYYQVDNILIDIIDPLFIGLHVLENSEFSFKMVKKRNAEEKVGVVGRRNDKLEVIEYSDLPAEEMHATSPDGSLKFWAGSIAIHVFNVRFIKKIVENGFKLPYHIAEKSIPFIDANGQKISPKEKNGIKFETFVFDAIKFARIALLLEVVREDEFGPVKNKDGEDSPVTAKNLYMEKSRRLLLNSVKNEAILKKIREAKLVEVNPLIAYGEFGAEKLGKQIVENKTSDFLFF